MHSFHSLNELNTHEYLEVEKIFFESASVQSFSGAEEKNAFLYKYFGYYKEFFPHFFIVIKVDGQIFGYICGAPETAKNVRLNELQPHLSLFKDQYDQFPCHLHINLALKATGKGLGSLLLERFEQFVAAQGIAGVHLITSPQSRNVHFYQKNGYKSCLERTSMNTPLLFMGKLLTY